MKLIAQGESFWGSAIDYVHTSQVERYKRKRLQYDWQGRVILDNTFCGMYPAVMTKVLLELADELPVLFVMANKEVVLPTSVPTAHVCSEYELTSGGYLKHYACDYLLVPLSCYNVIPRNDIMMAKNSYKFILSGIGTMKDYAAQLRSLSNVFDYCLSPLPYAYGNNGIMLSALAPQIAIRIEGAELLPEVVDFSFCSRYNGAVVAAWAENSPPIGSFIDSLREE